MVLSLTSGDTLSPLPQHELRGGGWRKGVDPNNYLSNTEKWGIKLPNIEVATYVHGYLMDHLSVWRGTS